MEANERADQLTARRPASASGRSIWARILWLLRTSICRLRLAGGQRAPLACGLSWTRAPARLCARADDDDDLTMASRLRAVKLIASPLSPFGLVCSLELKQTTTRCRRARVCVCPAQMVLRRLGRVARATCRSAQRASRSSAWGELLRSTWSLWRLEATGRWRAERTNGRADLLTGGRRRRRRVVTLAHWRGPADCSRDRSRGSPSVRVNARARALVWLLSSD